MKTNMGKADKSIRLFLGVLIIAVGIYYQSWWGAIGAIPIITSIVSWCPFYVPFGISTKLKKNKI